MGFRVVERTFSDSEDCPSILLANINCSTDVKKNLDKMERIIQVAHEKDVNIVIFPELSVTGYVWDTINENDVLEQLQEGENSRIHSWVKNIRDSLRNDGKGLQYVFYNNVREKEGSLLNSTFIINKDMDHREEGLIYDKVFLTPLEQRFFKQGSDKRLIIDTGWGRFGFLICYDLVFVELARKYAFVDEVDALITMADWRSEAIREYSHMNVRTDHYYGYLWDLMNSSKAAYNQIWSLGANNVGRHEVSQDYFWGGSGVWAPSGMKLLQASNINQELLIVYNLDLRGQRLVEKDDFNYRIDFHRLYNKIDDADTRTQYLP
ncbi:MAG: carbon-nitrogen hydrolase family protein [Candidatus Syntrophonatronum acetioxidans]|uniref:Carbon-nitrogen hydrolase family protein n=1 Tax=Candidatus Syntrophonatronum acetioxidans TaxID=1795816 RepID=A0A424YBE2_9FIRM|nr:MAG: carbon-nitrogen hydrolase family protein [Candidatus Syntrophonatronum acetioxidans]